MLVPQPTPIYRFIHLDNLRLCLERRGLCAPNHAPNDGFVYRTIHNVDVQNKRHATNISCGPGGTIHDYVPFYFGYLSPMMLNLKTGRVQGYTEGQTPLIYLVSTVQAIRDGGARFVFSDGHGLATFTEWFDDLARLDRVDWSMVYQRYWAEYGQATPQAGGVPGAPALRLGADRGSGSDQSGNQGTGGDNFQCIPGGAEKARARARRLVLLLRGSR